MLRVLCRYKNFGWKILGGNNIRKYSFIHRFVPQGKVLNFWAKPLVYHKFVKIYELSDRKISCKRVRNRRAKKEENNVRKDTCSGIEEENNHDKSTCSRDEGEDDESEEEDSDDEDEDEEEVEKVNDKAYNITPCCRPFKLQTEHPMRKKE